MGDRKMEYFFLPSLFLPARGGRDGPRTHSLKPSWQKEGGQKKWNTFFCPLCFCLPKGGGAGCSPTRPSRAGRKKGGRKNGILFLPSLFLPAKGGSGRAAHPLAQAWLAERWETEKWNTFFCPLCFCLPKGGRNNGILFSALFVSACQRGFGGGMGARVAFRGKFVVTLRGAFALLGGAGFSQRSHP